MKFDRRLGRKLHRMVFANTDEDLREDFEQWWEGAATFFAERTTLHPGRRAVVDRAIHLPGTHRPKYGEPRYGTRIPVEVWWQRPDENGLPYITAWKQEAPPGKVFNPTDEYESDIPLGSIWAGLVLRLDSGGPAVPESAPPPASGKAPSLAHYRAVLAAYDDLVREGHPAPISVLADRFQARPGTVKSWLHRGRRYLKGEQP
jgi:hypothetical protein